MKFPKIKKIIVTIFTISACCIFIGKFGKVEPLKENTEIVWHLKNNPPVPIDNFTSKEKIPAMINIVFSLYAAAMDKSVTKLKIVDSAEGAISVFSAQEIINLINLFKYKNKEVVFYSENFSTNSYLIASACNQRILAQDGGLEFLGCSITGQFIKNRLNKKKIDFIGWQIGDFKGGLQQETDTGFDYYCVANRKAFLEDISNQTKILLEVNLNKDRYEVQKLFDKAYFSADQAYQEGLVDKLAYYVPSKNEMTLEAYHKRLQKKAKYSSNRVKWIWIDPIIVKPRTRIMIKKLHAIANDPYAKVVVLFVACNGGCAQSSFMLYDAILNLRKNGKYVIAYVQHAYSGGYVVASACDKIITRSGSGIGSIGIFGKMTMMKRYYQKKGIEFDTISVDESQEFGLNISKKANSAIKRDLQNGYEYFAKLVAKSRKIDLNAVYDIAQGQIFSGFAAKELNLVDSLGGVFDLLELIFAIYKGPFDFDFTPDMKMLIELESAYPILTA